MRRFHLRKLNDTQEKYQVSLEHLITSYTRIALLSERLLLKISDKLTQIGDNTLLSAIHKRINCMWNGWTLLLYLHICRATKVTAVTAE
jgi:hypothetical protein